jgi:hypothetical protein
MLERRNLMILKLKLRFMRLVIFYICHQFRDKNKEEIENDKKHILTESLDLVTIINNEINSMK